MSRHRSNSSPCEVRHGVLVLSGYGIRLSVERGHLAVEDGVGSTRRRERFPRVDERLKRVVVIGRAGMITLDAIAWLQGVHVPLIHLDYDGRVLFVSSPWGRTIAELRRRQVRAGETDTGLTISRALVTAKIERQRAVLPQLPDGPEADDFLAAKAADAGRASTLIGLRDHEAQAARAYWRAWRRLPVRIQAEQARRRPRHWQVFGNRNSMVMGISARRAITPANAVLNYLYAILEAEAIIAAQVMRLDPALGFLHQDRQERPSLACDLMEPARPAVDAFALSLFQERVFTTDDVFELPDGQCRLLPPLTHELSATAGFWAEQIRPVTEYVAEALATPRPKRTLVPGVLAPTLGRKRARARTSLVRAFDGLPDQTWRSLTEPEHDWAGMRASQRIRSANRAWETQHGRSGDPRIFRTEILPSLARLPLRHLSAVTGLTTTTCSLVRRGLRLPHPRHWPALRALIGVDTGAASVR